jgi:hypothetical protein
MPLLSVTFAMAKAAFNNKNLFTSKLELNLRKKLDRAVGIATS